jgi:photosystem II stability/assembly factor-like uncharacterized protein
MAGNDIAIIRGGDTRVFIQSAGISPANPYDYYGCMQLEGPEQAQGDPTPVYCPSTTQRNAWDIVDEAPTVQELGSTDFTQRMDRYLSDSLWDIRRRRCVFNLQAVIGRCQNPSDFTQWDSKIILKDARLTSFSLPQMNILDGSDNGGLDMTGSFSFRDIINIKSMRFSEVGDTTIVAEVLDGLYSDTVQCGDCGPASDGCQKFYGLTLANGGSPGLSSQLIHSSNGGDTITGIDIPTLGGLSGTRMAVVGNKVVVISQPNLAHHYATVTDVDNDTVNWTKVSSGYVAAKGPRALYVKSPSQTFIAGAGGYIYLMTDPTLAVTVISDGSVSSQQLNDIGGIGQTIVAVGGSNAVLRSDNGGAGFSLIVGPAVGIALNAIAVLSKNVWLIGAANGRLYYTINGGTSWVLMSIPSTINVINRIQFVDDIVGYMAVQTTSGAAAVYRTSDSGHSWSNTSPDISDLPTAERINFCAPCGYNTVAAGGRKTSAGDGLLAIAQ